MLSCGFLGLEEPEHLRQGCHSVAIVQPGVCETVRKFLCSPPPPNRALSQCGMPPVCTCTPLIVLLPCSLPAPAHLSPPSISRLNLSLPSLHALLPLSSLSLHHAAPFTNCQRVNDSGQHLPCIFLLMLGSTRLAERPNTLVLSTSPPPNPCRYPWSSVVLHLHPCHADAC